MKSKILVLCLTLAVIVSIAGCGSSAGSSSTTSQTNAKHIVIGLSNGYVGNVWRAQMEQDFKTYASELKAQGKIADYVVAEANNSVPTQIQQIRDMINKGVNPIVICATSSTALNPVVDEAVSKGITVLSFDNIVNDPKSINILLDENVFAKGTADQVAQLIGGKGNVVIVDGVAGTPVNNLREQLAKEALAKYPGIKIVATIYGGWSDPLTKQKMADVISAYPEIDGVVDQGGEADGAMQAFSDAGRKLPVIQADGTYGSFQIWHDHMAQGYKTAGSLVPPGEVYTAMAVGLRVVNGSKVKSNNITYPCPLITNATLDQYYKPGQPPGNFVDIKWDSGSDFDNLFQ